ncbi:MAG: 3'-5' exonuclease [Bacteroidales bacterium]|nr:3'-5' exonuclease [Bacteroidales bacterium]
MFSFTAVDFETAAGYIPCSVGIAVVEDNKITEVRTELIKPICFPYFHWYAQRIHGIYKQDVENAPTFEELWPEIKHYFSDTMLIAHNAAFDINVLRRTLAHYQLPRPYARYMCSYILAKKTWKNNAKFSLDFLSNQENIPLNHHHADSDAAACAMLLLREAEVLGCQDFAQLKHLTQLRSYRL